MDETPDFNTDHVIPPVAQQPLAEPAETAAGRSWMSDLLLLLAWIALTDWLLYRTGTFLTWGLFFLISVAFLGLARYRGGHRRGSWLTGILLGLLGLKLFWCGSLLQIIGGVFLLFCYAMARSGSPPLLPEIIGFLGSVIFGAATSLGRVIPHPTPPANGTTRGAPLAQFLLPIGIVVLFGTLFVLANPDVATSFRGYLRTVHAALESFLTRFSLGEGLFWVLSGLLLLGFLYPARTRLLQEKKPTELSSPQEPSPWYRAYRNSLVSVSALFAVYLAFDFSTLWFREFPPNFYYAGYAHQGAFWLTLALALATLVLSTIFQGTTLADPPLQFLKRLAMIWSVENLLLSAAVYNRLFIYIDFNGMTRMRVVGLLGITAVVVGFSLVVLKLLRNRDIVWLLHRQLWVPTLAVIAYTILPVDWLVNRYNAHQVLNGNLPPSVQIVAHRTSAEGILPLADLVDTEEPVIRNGIRALLALWSQELVGDVKPAWNPAAMGSESTAARRSTRRGWQSKYGHSTPWLQGRPRGWREPATSSSGSAQGHLPWQSFQGSEVLLKAALERTRPKWDAFANDWAARDAALDEYFKFAYRWY